MRATIEKRKEIKYQSWTGCVWQMLDDLKSFIDTDIFLRTLEICYVSLNYRLKRFASLLLKSEVHTMIL